jgi:hypothetical protein
VISLCQDRHRHQEWLRFLRLVDDATPGHKQLHLIVGNYATHKHPVVQRWLKSTPSTITSTTTTNIASPSSGPLLANDILEKVKRARKTLVNVQSG